MSKPAAIPFFGDAYLADTTHLTTEEHGAYFLLLLAAWRQDDCALPNDDRKLARITGLTPRKWGAIRGTILEFWTIENGRIFQPRLRKEHAYVCKKSETNRKSAEVRWSKQGTENKQNGGMRTHSERNAPPPPPSDTNVSHTRKRAVGKCSIPDDWELPAKAALPPKARACAEQWTDASYETHGEAFRNFWLADGRKYKDWTLVWANRIVAIHGQVMRDQKYGNAAPAAPQSQQPKRSPAEWLAFCEERAKWAREHKHAPGVDEWERKAAEARARLGIAIPNLRVVQ